MKIDLRHGALSLITMSLLVGCGSSSSDDTTTEVTTTDTALNKTGYFIDSPVEGSQYRTSSGFEGLTDPAGRFIYKEGDTVDFSIGNLKLGEATPALDGLVTPETLANGDEELKILLLRTLQALDVDNDPTNGITIPSTVSSSLSTIEETSIADVDSDEALLDLDTELSLALDENFDGVIDVDATQAELHYQQSKSDWDNGYRPDNTGTNATTQDGDCNNSVDINGTPLSTLTPALKEGIAFMGNEERLAYDVYHNLYNYHLENTGAVVNQLKNISENSEVTHVGIVQDLVNKYELTPEEVPNVTNPVASREVSFAEMPSGTYGIPHIQELYDILYAKGSASQQDALEVGCMVEVTDINDLDERILLAEEANASDVIDAFNFLRDASYTHYWAFDDGLKTLGVTTGCCSLGVIDGVDYCHPEYPREDNSTTQGGGQQRRGRS